MPIYLYDWKYCLIYFVCTCTLLRVTNIFVLLQLNSALQQAVKYVEKNLEGCGNDPYAASIVAYALGLTGSSKAGDALKTVESLATTQGRVEGN